MNNRQQAYTNHSPIVSNDFYILMDRIITLEQELSDLTFEFKQTLKELKRN